MRGAYFILIRILADKKDGAESDRQEKSNIRRLKTKEILHKKTSAIPGQYLILGRHDF
jgi:hypothetical protein